MGGVHETVRRLWSRLHLPPKKIVVYPNIQAAIDDASPWRHTVIHLKKGAYNAPTTMKKPYVDIVGEPRMQARLHRRKDGDFWI